MTIDNVPICAVLLGTIGLVLLSLQIGVHLGRKRQLRPDAPDVIPDGDERGQPGLRRLTLPELQVPRVRLGKALRPVCDDAPPARRGTLPERHDSIVPVTFRTRKRKRRDRALLILQGLPGVGPRRAVRREGRQSQALFFQYSSVVPV